MDTYFRDKVAVITGAGGTICSQLAKDLAADGIIVVLVGRTESSLQKVADAITEAGGRCMVYPADVTDEGEMNALAETVMATYGRVDYLINGAGGNNALAQPTITKFDPRELDEEQPEGLRGFLNVDMDAFEQVLRLNTMGTVYPTRAFSRYMVKKGGSIVNFASMNSYCPLTRNFAYAMGKAAAVSITKSLAAYFSGAGIRVNAVAPGFVVNERSKLILGTVEEGLTQRGKDVIAHTPQGKFGQAGDMTGCVRWLLDERASGFVTGATIPVDGGFLTLSGV